MVKVHENGKYGFSKKKTKMQKIADLQWFSFACFYWECKLRKQVYGDCSTLNQLTVLPRLFWVWAHEAHFKDRGFCFVLFVSMSNVHVSVRMTAGLCVPGTHGSAREYLLLRGVLSNHRWEDTHSAYHVVQHWHNLEFLRGWRSRLVGHKRCPLGEITVAKHKTSMNVIMKCKWRQQCLQLIQDSGNL